MKIGIGIPNQVRELSPALIPAWAARAEEAGFSSLGTLGRIAYPGVMDTVALAAAAGATSRIQLFSNILIGVVWPPVLLAKEVAGIDGVSGGRLTLGLGLGGRSDDFVAEGAGPRGLGRRFDHDLQVYRDVWRGQPIGGGTNPAVPSGTREVPMLFGGFAPASFARMARWGEGYISAAVPVSTATEIFDTARAAWQEAGREGSPRLVAITYFAFGDIDKGRGNIRDYYLASGEEMAEGAAAGVHGGAEAVKEVVRAFADIGTDELILNPTLADVDEIARLADAVL
jgi:alkanesulfonate monooxygenase SsuD/methylene tetrahydromethanopterin reductase-like flavin-dependent oxidoreductase (luciferase family)